MRRIRKIALSERGIFEPVRNEEDAVREIMDMLALNGAVVRRVTERIPRRDAYGRIRGRVSDPGIPDLQGFVLATDEMKLTVPYWIEIKGPTGQLRPAQRQFLEAYQAAGLFAFMARSWAEVKVAFADRGIRFKVG